MRASPPDWRAKPYTIDRPSPVPVPSGLVVKNGSNARAATPCAIPVPVSDTVSATSGPAGRSASPGTTAVSIVSVPPAGIASCALRHRFRIAFSSWFASASTGGRPGVAFTTSATLDPTVRPMSSTMP